MQRLRPEEITLWGYMGADDNMTRDELLDRTLAVLELHSGVVGVWLVGSLAENGDSYSDIDLHVVVGSDALDGFLDKIEDVIRPISDPVLIQTRGSLVNVVTREWLRMDLFVTGDADLRAPAGPRKIALDPQGRLALAKIRSDDLTQTEWADQTVNEFIRCIGLLPFVMAREEWIGAYLGTQWMVQIFIDLFQIENGIQRRVGGALSISQRLTEEQRAMLRRIPLLRPEGESIVATQIWLANAFLPRALFDAKGWGYPKEFEQATIANLVKAGISLNETR